MDPITKEDDLFDWLNEFQFSKPKRNLGRDFADGVLTAEILKKFYPRIVQLHNYSSANSIANKLQNWITLNDKVLTKIGIAQSHDLLKEAAGANKIAIEKILMCIKSKLGELEISKKTEDSDPQTLPNTDDGTRVVELHVKSTVSFEDYHLVLEKLTVKEEEIQGLQAKVAHLEAMIDLKDQRINDLTFQVKRCTCFKN